MPESEREEMRSTTADGWFDPGTYKVGGRRVPQPTGRDRDSSLKIEYGPWEYLISCREAQTASDI